MKMKTINNKYLAILIALVVMSCSDDYFDVNRSQNDPETSTPQLTLPVAQKYSADYLSGNYGSVNTLGNIWAYTWAAAGDYIYFTEEMQYNVTSGFRNGTFEGAYLLPLVNYNYVENYGNGSATDGAEYGNFRAIAKIMKAFHYQYLVDAYGDIPYTEALQGNANTTPAYDDAEFVYTSIYTELNNALALIDEGTGNENFIEVGTEDVMFNGNMVKWAKFANSIKLRILLRQSETGTSLAAQYAELNASPYGFLGAGENAYVNPGYTMQAGKQNPLWDAFGETSAGSAASNAQATRATDYVLAKLESYNDPREGRLYAPASDTDTFEGIAQNDQLATSPKSAALSGVGPGVLKGPAQNAIIMQSAESLLLQAEAAQRGFLPGNAQALYESAIEQSFIQLGVEPTIADPEATPPVAGVTTVEKAMAYYNQNINNVGWAASANKIEAIITQKWIALNGTNGFENWIEYRRTDFPSDLPSAPNATQPTIPIRLLYPSSEAGSNPGNAPVQTGSDAFNSPVFWDM